MVVRASAKINLNLLVGPRRSDGFHPLDSYVAKVTLYDEVRLRRRSDGEIRLACRGIECGDDEKNLALRAARALAEQGGVSAGADVALSKRIPPGRGLGGGSSDAAAVLYGLNELWRLDVPEGELFDLAARLGSDVPLFLGPAACRMTGRGETVEPVRVHPFVAVLVLPRAACATAKVYRACDDQPAAMGQQLSPRMIAEQPPSAWRGLLVNQLASAARRVCMELDEVWTKLAGAVGLTVAMSGSGSALFILCDDEAEASAAMADVPSELKELCVLVRQNDW